MSFSSLSRTVLQCSCNSNHLYLFKRKSSQCLLSILHIKKLSHYSGHYSYDMDGPINPLGTTENDPRIHKEDRDISKLRASELLQHRNECQRPDKTSKIMTDPIVVSSSTEVEYTFQSPARVLKKKYQDKLTENETRYRVSGLTIEDARHFTSGFGKNAYFIECINILKTPIIKDASAENETGVYATEDNEDPQCYTLALACGLRYLTIEEILGLFSGKEMSTLERSKYYHSYYEIYQNGIIKKNRLPDIYIYETIFLKLKRTQDWDILYGFFNHVKGLEVQQNRFIINTLIYNVIIKLAVELNNSNINEIFNEMKSGDYMNLRSWIYYISWTVGRGGTLEDIQFAIKEALNSKKIEKLCLLTESFDSENFSDVTEPLYPLDEDIPHGTTQQERTNRFAKMFLLHAISTCIKCKRLKDSYGLFEDLMRLKNTPLSMKRACNLYSQILKLYPLSSEIVQKYLSYLLIEEPYSSNDLNGERVYVINKESGITTMDDQIELLCRIVKFFRREDTHLAMKVLKGVKKHYEDSIGGFNVLLSIISDFKLSLKERADIVDFYCENSSSTTVPAHSLNMTQKHLVDMIPHLPSSYGKVIKHIVNEGCSPDYRTFNIILNFISLMHSKKSTNSIVNEASRKFLFYHILKVFKTPLLDAFISPKTKVIDYVGMNILLDLARGENETKWMYILAKILVDEKGVIASSNLDITYRLSTLNHFLSTFTVLPNRATVEDLEDLLVKISEKIEHRIIGTNELYNEEEGEEEEEVENETGSLWSKNIPDWMKILKAKGIENIGQIRAIKNYEFKSRFPELNSTAIKWIIKALGVPNLKVDVVPWNEQKGSIKGGGISHRKSSIVLTKNGKLVHYTKLNSRANL